MRFRSRAAAETEARILAAQQKMKVTMDKMNERIQDMTLRIQGQVAKDLLTSKFENGQKIDYYNWTQSYSYKPGRRCFASNQLLIPGTQAYKGTYTVGREKIGDPTPSRVVFPSVIWISKEEFIVRRLKGHL